MKITKKLMALLIVVLLALSIVACNDTETPQVTDGNGVSTADTSANDASSNDKDAETVAAVGVWADATYRSDMSFGTGSKTVQVKVEADGCSVTFTIHTDAEKLGDALLAHSLVAGENSTYGLYIKSVNGIIADYDIDKTYWGFYKNGDYMITGVDRTIIADGEHYELVRTK